MCWCSPECSCPTNTRHPCALPLCSYQTPRAIPGALMQQQAKKSSSRHKTAPDYSSCILKATRRLSCSSQTCRKITYSWGVICKKPRHRMCLCFFRIAIVFVGLGVLSKVTALSSVSDEDERGKIGIPQRATCCLSRSEALGILWHIF